MHLALAHNKPEATYVKFHENVSSQKNFFTTEERLVSIYQIYQL